MVVLALGMGLLMTAIAVAIGGLTIEAVLLLINYRLQAVAATNEQRGRATTNIIHLERENGDDLTAALEWAENVAA